MQEMLSKQENGSPSGFHLRNQGLRRQLTGVGLVDIHLTMFNNGIGCLETFASLPASFSKGEAAGNTYLLQEVSTMCALEAPDGQDDDPRAKIIRHFT